MTALLPARAQIAASRLPRRPLHRHVTRLGLTTVVGLGTVAAAAGLAWPATAETDDTDPSRPGTAATSAAIPAGHAATETEAGPERSRTAGVRPRPLAPTPPPDGRDAPDPFILADDSGFVPYSTQVGYLNVPVATSPDLRRWSPPHDALPQLPAWAAWGRTWAPGVVRLDGRYLLFFAAHHQPSGRQCTGVATSAAATGLFMAHGSVPLVCQSDLGGSIDPHPFVDHDGTAHLLWKADGNAIGQRSTLYAQRLTPDGLALTGQPMALLTSGAPWEQPLIENPALVATGRIYLLLYSGGWWESAGYAIGYATCATPLGPCTKATVDRPLVASAGDQAGPGGASVVTGPAGEHWLAYHAWNPGAIGYTNGGTRSLHFASLTWLNNQPIIAR